MTGNSLVARARRANQHARSHLVPVGAGESERFPALEVAGVWVFVYLDDDATVRISAHWDTADVSTFPHWTEVVPVRVSGVDPGQISEPCPGLIAVSPGPTEARDVT